MTPEKAIIEISRSAIDLILLKPGGEKIQTGLTPNTFRKIFADVGFKTPLLPPQCRLYIEKGSRAAVVIERPPIKQAISFEITPGKIQIYEDVFVPQSLFTLIFDRDRFWRGYLASLPGTLDLPKQLNEDTPVIRWPWGNIHIDGKVCWGANETNTFSLKNGVAVTESFFHSTFNIDLNDHAHLFVQECVGRSGLPLNQLRKCERFETVSEFIRFTTKEVQ